MLDRLLQLRRAEPVPSATIAPDTADRVQAAHATIASARDLLKPFAIAALAGDADAIAAIDAIEREVQAARRLVDLAELAAEAAREEQEATRDAQRRQVAINEYRRLLPGYRAAERDRHARLTAQIDQCKRSREDRQAELLEQLRDESRIPPAPPGWSEQGAA